MDILKLVILAAMMVLPWTVLRAADAAAGADAVKIGVAAVDITPEGPIWQAGYAARTKPSEGVEQPIFVKAIAFEDSRGARAVIVTSDVIGLHRELADAIAARIRDALGIPRERVILSSSHTHSGPVLHGSTLEMYDMNAEQREAVAAYTKRFEEKAFDVARKAVESIATGTIAFGSGEAHVAVNRRAFSPNGVYIGVNPLGPVADEVPVLAARDAKGDVRGLLFGYACHGTTLGGDCYRIGGDYMGFAQTYLELAHPDATALYAPGCGADANPHPRGALAHARQHGLAVAGAVADVASHPMAPVRGPITCAFRLIDLAFAEPPTKEEFAERLESTNPHIRRHARRMLDIIEKDGALPRTYPYPVQVWRFGRDLTVVALGGEVVVDYALRIERELAPRKVWVIAFSNDVCGYIGSTRVLFEGGYEADDSTIYYQLPCRWANDVEDRIIRAVRELAGSL
ncbi:MAG: neutral/alkaline non-lysosomal ceramidase N-terminal domain-containing protein [Planctomycetes bacterium]|nr:neutral/alkaline non-lysosomal ceramidase N-terminal domain-containing protein [Planctomycetota bacterium]